MAAAAAAPRVKEAKPSGKGRAAAASGAAAGAGGGVVPVVEATALPAPTQRGVTAAMRAAKNDMVAESLARRAGASVVEAKPTPKPKRG